MKQALSLTEVMAHLTSQNVTEITRTHGSMFFLELGQLITRKGLERPHGEWHFLFELCNWRITSTKAMLVGSEDNQEFIDKVFASNALGSVESTDVQTPTGDLKIVFSSGLMLSTFTTSAKATEDDWTQWRLYCPDDDVWSVDGSGAIVCRNAYEARI